MATEYLDPISNGATTEWDYHDYTNVDDGVRQPTVPTASPATTETVYNTDGKPTEDATWKFAIGHQWRRVTEVTLWTYRSYTGDYSASFSLNFNGAMGAHDSAQTVGNWYGQTWTGLAINLWAGVAPVVTGTFPAITKGDDSSAYSAVYLEYEDEAYDPGANEQITATNHSYESTGGTVTLNPGDTRDIDESSEFVAFQFDGVGVEQGQTVEHAWLEITRGTDNVGAVTVKADDVDAPVALTATSTDVSGRTATTASETWSNPTEGGSIELDIAPVIQEVVDRAGWTAENRMVVIVEGVDPDTSDFEIDLAVDATLDLGYTTSGGGGGGGGSMAAITHNYRRRRTP